MPFSLELKWIGCLMQRYMSFLLSAVGVIAFYFGSRYLVGDAQSKEILNLLMVALPLVILLGDNASSGRVLDEKDGLIASLKQSRARINENYGKALADKNGAYSQRNNLAALLARQFPAGRKLDHSPNITDEWRNVVMIDLPTGQVSFHYHINDSHMFSRLPEYPGEWDGHNKADAMRRIERYYQALDENAAVYGTPLEAKNDAENASDPETMVGQVATADEPLPSFEEATAAEAKLDYKHIWISDAPRS